MTVRQLTLNDYRDLVSRLPRPTAEQMDALAWFFSQAHSWYKRLPLLLPAGKVCFFLNPSAGTEREGARMVERTEQGFHYSWIPTRLYRERFGHLSFCLEGGDDWRQGPSDDALAIFDAGTTLVYRLPKEAILAGTTRFSAIVHPVALQYWDLMARQTPPAEWPEECGGTKALHAIIERCRALVQDPSLAKEPAGEEMYRIRDTVLYELLEPERRRQHRAMVEAMTRAVEILASRPG